jgi:hypothetical protein
MNADTGEYILPLQHVLMDNDRGEVGPDLDGGPAVAGSISACLSKQFSKRGCFILSVVFTPSTNRSVSYHRENLRIAYVLPTLETELVFYQASTTVRQLPDSNSRR